MPFQVGDVVHISNFEFTRGGDRNKFLIVLAPSRSDDWILATTTSRPYDRPRNPACSYGDRPSFYLGQAGLFAVETWVCLAELFEREPQELAQLESEGRLDPIGSIGNGTLINLLECAARAHDTTGVHENALLNLKEQLQGG